VKEGKISFHAMGRKHYPGARLAPHQLDGLLSAGNWDARGDQGWGMEPHRNEGVEICLLETGSMRFAVDGGIHPLGPGNLTITRPWQMHRQGDPNIAASRLHWATIDVQAERPDQPWIWPDWVLLAPSDCLELTRRLRQTTYPVWRASSDVLQGFHRVASAVMRAPDVSRMSRLAIGLNELLLGVLEILRAENCAAQPVLARREHTVKLFLDDLRQNLASLSQPWTLGSMAAACGTGTTGFSRVCRMLTNDSPARYLSIARLDAAARLLLEQASSSVTDIAFNCGFQSSQHFAHQFHRRFGHTPSEHRKSRG
jgi:AraC family L-rhamnose operon regulatory protein RhaS